MITLLLCKCGGAELLARQKLMAAGMKDYLKPRAISGEEECLKFLEQFPQDNKEIGLAKMHLKLHSSYAIVFGYKDDGKIRWTDVADSSPIAALDAGVIVKNYQ